MCVVYIYSCGCVHMWMCGYASINIGFAHVCGNTHIWRPQVSSLIAFHPTFEIRSLSLILKLLDSSRLAGQWAPGICLCLLTLLLQYWSYRCRHGNFFADVEPPTSSPYASSTTHFNDQAISQAPSILKFLKHVGFICQNKKIWHDNYNLVVYCEASGEGEYALLSIWIKKSRAVNSMWLYRRKSHSTNLKSPYFNKITK